MQVAKIGFENPGRFFDAGVALSDLKGVLSRLIAKRPVAIFDWPDYLNAGEHLIWLGQKAILQECCKEIVLEGSLRSIDLQKITALPRDTVVICQGGGNFGDLYPAHQKFRELLILALPDHRIILMPQSVHFESQLAVKTAKMLFATHGDLHVFASDRLSLKFIRANITKRNTYLGIDAAFALKEEIKSIVSQCPEPTEDTLCLLRKDDEAMAFAGREALIEKAKDWSQPDDLERGEDDKLFSLTECGISSSCFSGSLDAISWRRLCGAVKLFSSAREIVTDRLHGHILCVLMEKPHIVYDNKYGKIKAFYETWGPSVATRWVDRLAFLRA